MYSTIFISIDLVYQYLFKINIIGIPINPDHNYGRASSFFKEELIAGSYIYKFSLPVIGYFLFHKKFIKAFLLINLYLIAIICSGERMSFLLYSLGILIFLIFVVKDIKRILIISISMLTIFAGSFYIFDGVKGRVDNFIVSMGFKNERIQDFGHAAHFMTAYQIFKENKIFGTGHKTFRLSCNEKRIIDKVNSLSQGCTTHPHNNYFEILTDSGLVGMIGFILLISLILIKAIKSKLIQKEACGFLISFITIIWPLSSAGNFFNNRIAIVNFFIIGFILLYSKKKVFK
jgi:O-antigen ligase